MLSSYARRAAGWWIACVLLVWGLSGCGGDVDGPPVGAVSGKVTYNGEPVTEGSVFFYSQQGYGGNGELGAGGAYTITSQYGQGLPLGEYQVAISPPPTSGPPPKDANDPGPEAPDPENIPAKYRDTSSSGFTAEVKDGNNTFDFDMQK